MMSLIQALILLFTAAAALLAVSIFIIGVRQREKAPTIVGAFAVMVVVFFAFAVYAAISPYIYP